MTGLKDHNVPAFTKAAKALRDAGYRVVNPPELDLKDPQRNWEDCLRRDIIHEMGCQEIATLPGWKKSRGANLEIYIGKQIKMPVHTVSYYLGR